MSERDHLIFYDQECGFCRRVLRIVYRRDQRVGRRLFPIALQDRAVDRELPQLSEPERMESWHLKLPDGEVLSGGAAIAPLFELLDLPQSIAARLRAHPERVDRCYRWGARNRRALGRLTRWLPDFDHR